jgi:hypothetical protein
LARLPIAFVRANGVDALEAVTVLVGSMIVVVWPMLIEWLGPDDDVLEAPPAATSTTITTMAATTSAIPPAIAQPRPRDRRSFMTLLLVRR